MLRLLCRSAHTPTGWSGELAACERGRLALSCRKLRKAVLQRHDHSPLSPLSHLLTDASAGGEATSE